MAGLLLAGEATAGLPPIPERPEAEVLKDAPAPWRDYLLKARAAERIADPLQRCLAFPDVPGNKWPAGHAQAHCRYHNAAVPSLADVEGYLQRGEAGALEKLLADALARHFSDSGFSEEIHPFFERFQGEPADADRVSALWLEKSPDSAFAVLARGVYFVSAAWKARGGKWASETPRESLREMSRMADQAVPLIRKAIKAEPRLMPGYVAAMDLAILDSRADLEAWAFQKGHGIDPGCTELVRYRMRSLEPRWGGSYEAMLAYAYELPALYPRRPQIAMYQAAPFGDRGNRLVLDDVYTQETADVLDIAVATGSTEAHLHDAANLAYSRTDAPKDQWKGLAYLLQEARFNKGGAWADRRIGWNLLRTEPEWALPYLVRAEATEPDSAWGQYLLGAAYYNSGRYEEAERHYLKALGDQKQRQASLRELTTMWLYDAGLAHKQAAAKAAPYIDRLRAEYPQDGRGFMYRMDQLAMAGGGRLDPEQMKQFLKLADRADPAQKRYAEEIEAAFRKAGIK
ncbi:tetratricopeptide repeat protein [Lysobacter solisilvae (ex Woo and Kim 2020)]|uniref:DUF4034 domain-containing protein n=1 Tax=Agrilutibacter terrestris TaxID=2865112 RepID=A0A7H0FXZ4_9GAMM|nr:tetratricopeptide repeat protein [Lysobacter terrestris]QNP40910.1 DUF4034 domain-containing protein [Lysobacter terrestris]